MPSMVWTILSFIIIFTLVVVSHEFGHFLIGRINGIKVNEFMIGMGPAIFKKKIGNVLLSIRILPIGGACVFDGMLDDEKEDEKAEEENEGEESNITKELMDDAKAGIPFRDAPVWARIATVFAGPLFNVVLAFLLSLFIVWFCGSDLPIIGAVSEGYPAAEAGIQAGDRIVKIDGENIMLWRDVSIISMLSSGKPMNITYERDGQRYETVLTPAYSAEEDRYYIGFVGAGKYIECNNLNVFKYAYAETRFWLIATVRSIGYMFRGHASLDDFSGPVGMATVIDDTIETSASYGVFTVILNMMSFCVLLSVNLGIMNLMPIPALDGGRLLFLIYEVIFKKPVPAEKEGIITAVGFILLMIFMVVVLFNDIMKLFR